MKVTNLSQCPSMSVNMEGAKDVSRKTPIGKADGAPHFSVRVFTVEPGGHTPHHTHPSEHVNYILSGMGELVADDGPKPLKPGDYVLVLPHELHQYRNTGSEPFVFMCCVPTEYE